MNHFKNKLTSPAISLTGGYIYMCILGIILYNMGFYKNSSFFSWGTPVILMGKKIEDDLTYYTILFMFFIHQIINNWINDVTYPWIINCIQDPKSKNTLYSKSNSMILVNLFALYSEIDIIIIIAGVMSQISFFIAIIIANLISVSIINWQYIKNKHKVVSFTNSESNLINTVDIV